jgi:hypothetical protein
LDVKRVEHAVAVVTTTHPVAVRHVKNNMALALLPSHSHNAAVHELHRRLRQHPAQNAGRLSPYSKVRHETRASAGSAGSWSQKRTHGLQARIPQA